MNEPIDRSLCGGTVHEYRALTGATGTDGNQDEKARGEAEGLHCGGGDGATGGRGGKEEAQVSR